MPFPEKLRSLRVANSITQSELGNKLNLSRTAISNYEHGKIQPSIETIIKIAEFFKISIDELLK